jgi:hypothetical protein
VTDDLEREERELRQRRDANRRAAKAALAAATREPLVEGSTGQRRANPLYEVVLKHDALALELHRELEAMRERRQREAEESFRGDLTLPATHEMEEEVERVSAWLSDALPARAEGYFLGPYLAHHVDDLVGDMGLPTRRTSNFVTEYLAPVRPARYRGLTEERRLVRSDGIPARRRLYLSSGHATAGLAALTLARAARRRRH